MSVLRPGGGELTRYALGAAQVEPGWALLDVGCGDGTAAALAQEEFGLKVTAVDLREESVSQAKERGVDARVMDASALDFSSRSFDVVMMECVFSTLDRQEEAFHEAYCMLRPGGLLILSDLYRRHPDRMRWRREYREAMAQFRRPRQEGDCEKQEVLPSPYCQDGALVLDGLDLLLEELGMEKVLFEDRTEDLKVFAGQAILDCGSVEEWFRRQGGWKPCACKAKELGYFLMIARKPDAG